MKIVNGIIELNSYELTIFDNSYSSILITTPYLDKDHPKILYVNNAFTRMSGYKAEEIINKTPRILQGEKTDREVLKRLKECLSQEEYFEGKAINYTKEGNEYWVEWNISPVYDENKKLIAFISIQKDISVSQKLLNQIKLFQTAIDQNDDSIALFSPKGDYIYVNRAYSQRTGYSESELIGKNPRILKSCQHNEKFYKNLWEKLLNKKPFNGVFFNKNAQGEIYYEKQTITPIVQEDEIIGFVVIGKDYDKDEQQKKQLQEDVFLDTLTKLFNKKAFEEKFYNAVENYNKNSISFSMMFIDLDNFKQVNDTMGHDKGDEALREVANFLKDKFRKNDDIFRFGGDEFIVLLYNIENKDAIEISNKIEDLFINSNIANNYNIGISIGAKQYLGEKMEDFFKETDKQMYLKKRFKKKI